MRRAYEGSFFPIGDYFFPHPVAAPPSTEIVASRPLYLPATDARRRRMIMGHKESVGQSGECLGIFAIRDSRQKKGGVGICSPHSNRKHKTDSVHMTGIFFIVPQ